MAGIFDLPDDKCRLVEDEIKGEEEFNEELKKQRIAGGANIDDDIFVPSARKGQDVHEQHIVMQQSTHNRGVD